MKLAEQDDALALRGFVISRTGVLPTDPSFRELSENDELLRWTVHWLQKRELDQYAQWSKLLGITWTREQIDGMVNNKPTAVAPKEMMIPLSLAVNGELFDALKKTFRVSKGQFIGGGEYETSHAEEVVELGDLPPEEFLQWANKATGTMKQNAEVIQDKERLVNIKEGDTGDERLDRIREQVAKSKSWRT